MQQWSKYAPLILIAIGLLGFSGQLQGCNFEQLPIPSPGPDPAVTEGSWIVVIEETDARTPAVTKVLTNDAYWLGLKSRGLKFRFYDIDGDHDYKPLAKEVGVPAMAIVHPTGKVLGKQRLPETIELVDTAVKKATGR